ncbi:ATP-binding cassette domain-containing protein [Rhodopseudomonas sp. HC1]|uniref:iron ABC transporter ATP-binding protein n=1 Tax=Rhodopseudomonas infernalis TaxID=2897386 RepID=UPI001EE7D082|nr:ATP-binding cassette domain-containing protein [Rhodopseudomonas infernalis]MCG6203404.1 ATP-binding cassette domain-containing protein [Rhodopseudomonas infernalis]
MIVVKNVSLAYQGAKILRDINLEIPETGVTALIGPNGAGKSSLLSLIARLQPIQTGSISVDGLPIGHTPSRVLARMLAILRQDPAIASRLKVRELVAFGRFPHNNGRATDEDRALTQAALERFDLTAFADRFIDTLSGGQRQLVLVAMTFCQGTRWLLLDEPLNNLDMFYARELMRSLREVADSERRAIVIVLHDINQAVTYADYIVALKNGALIASGTPDLIANTASLRQIFGYDMPVETYHGKPIVLNHL